MSLSDFPTIHLVAKDHSAKTGIGRYAQTLYHALGAADVPVAFHTPSYPFPAWTQAIPKRMGYDLDTFFRSYPFAVPPAAQSGILHLTTQSLATIFAFKRVTPSVITVHDILGYLLRDKPDMSHYRHGLEKFMDTWAVRSLRRADWLIADSEYTRQTIIDSVGISGERISVVYLGIDAQTFQPRAPKTDIAARYGLHTDVDAKAQYLLYVGSESPRKNLSMLIDALNLLAPDFPDLRLIKAGAAHDTVQHERLLQKIETLGLRNRVIFIDNMSEDELVDLYNQVDVAVQPSFYEGFGFPVLEAMASGTPVVSSNATSLPELAGDAALSVSPHDAAEMAAAIRRILTDSTLATDLRTRGIAQARTFTWSRTVEQTLAIYRQIADARSSGVRTAKA